MPARLIREDMLDSERVQTLPVEARWLYVSILLSADDLGIFQAAPYRLARRAVLDYNSVLSLLQLLVDADLVRLYQVDGKHFGFIPRYKQRLRLHAIRQPLPPAALMADDKDALNKIKDLAAKVSAERGEVPKTDSEVRPEAEAELKNLPSVGVRRSASDPKYRVPDCPYGQIVEAYHEALPALPRMVVVNNARRAALRARWTEVCAAERFDAEQGLRWFAEFFKKLSFVPFLAGRNERNWKADLEWLTAPKNFAKAIEGRYSREAT